MSARATVAALAATVMATPSSGALAPAAATGSAIAVDVAVYDASSGGVVAAVAAARHGARTLLICASWPACHPEGGLRVGGMSSGGLGQTDIGGCSDAIGGIAREFYTRNRQHYGNLSTDADVSRVGGVAAGSDCRLPSPDCNETFNLEPHVALDIFEAMLREAGVDVIYGEQVESVAKDGPTVTSITLTNGTTVAARVFVEASYEADLVARAGVSYIVGRESNTTYNETLNGNTGGLMGNQFRVAINPFWPNGTILPHVASPPYGTVGEGDKRVQAYNFRLCVSSNPTRSVPIEKPAGYNPSDWELLRREAAALASGADGVAVNLGCGAIPGSGSKCDMNNGGGLSTDFIGGSWEYPDADYEARKQIWQAHKSYTQGFLWTVANDPVIAGLVGGGTRLCADEFNATGHWPPALYVRAARRLRGPKVFTQNTPREQAVAGGVGNLSIGIGCYNFDSHNAQRMACHNKAECYGRGPPGVADDVPFAWDEGDVQVGPGRYEIPLWVTLPHPNETTNVMVIASPSASHIGMSTLRMEPQFMIIGHSVGVAAAMAASAAKPKGPGAPADVNAIDVDALHAKLLADGQILTASGRGPPGPAPPPLSACELGRCLSVDANAAKAAHHVFNGTTCGNTTTRSDWRAAGICSPLLADEWLANVEFWSKGTTVGSVIRAKSSTFLKKSTVNSEDLPPGDVKAVSAGDACRLLNATVFASYVLCSPLFA